MLSGRLGGRDSGPHRGGEAGDQGEVARLGQVSLRDKLGLVLNYICVVSSLNVNVINHDQKEGVYIVAVAVKNISRNAV